MKRCCWMRYPSTAVIRTPVLPASVATRLPSGLMASSLSPLLPPPASSALSPALPASALVSAPVRAPRTPLPLLLLMVPAPPLRARACTPGKGETRTMDCRATISTLSTCRSSLTTASSWCTLSEIWWKMTSPLACPDTTMLSLRRISMTPSAVTDEFVALSHSSTRSPSGLKMYTRPVWSPAAKYRASSFSPRCGMMARAVTSPPILTALMSCRWSDHDSRRFDTIVSVYRLRADDVMSSPPPPLPLTVCP
mmetsp:Transcript_23810/g.59038  ORF Transcript_23810/g.59038 Transcript_23810/m.59038 type:complete len:252 (-) Transcript_23810:6-761(-)